jgi:hypothetical protein
MKKLTLLLFAIIMLFSCNKEIIQNISRTDPVILADESEVLRPPGGYSSSKRADDYVEAQLKGKPVKNNIGNITDLSTTVVSAYQIDLYFSGVRNAVSYNIYRNDILIANSIQPHYIDKGLTAGTKYKYQVAAVAPNGVQGNLSNIAFGTTFSTDIGSKIILYQSFNGDTTNSSYWIPYNAGLPVITGPSGFTEEEKQRVTDSVAAAWARFPNVKITRNKAEYDASSPGRRFKTIYTQDYFWYCDVETPCAGGVSYLDVLGLDIPNYVFTSALYYSTYYSYKAGTHELGHGVGGLHHAVDYYPGQNYGNDGNYMGAGYSTPFMFWSDWHLISTGALERQIDMITARTQ